jgi:hypothetical protein
LRRSRTLEHRHEQGNRVAIPVEFVLFPNWRFTQYKITLWIVVDIMIIREVEHVTKRHTKIGCRILLVFVICFEWDQLYMDHESKCKVPATIRPLYRKHPTRTKFYQ